MRITHGTLETGAKCYSRTHDPSKIEDCPKDRDEHALLTLCGVRHHQRTLRGPKQRCTDTEDGTGRDNKITRVRMDVDNTAMQRFSNITGSTYKSSYRNEAIYNE